MRMSGVFMVVMFVAVPPGGGAVAQYFGPPPPPPPIFMPPPGPFNQQYAPAQLQRPAGGRCMTPYGFCMMGGIGPIGAPCFCQSVNGPLGGQIMQ
ncbi:MAG: hypothetical protein ACAH27_09245 [Xanthobacteraceae bacterium]